MPSSVRTRHRQVGVDRPDRLLHLLQQRRRLRAVGANRISHRSLRRTASRSQKSCDQHRPVDRRRRGLATPSSRMSPTTPTIVRHGLFGLWRMRRAERGRRILPVLAREVLRDHDHRCVRVDVRPGDRASGDEAVAHRLEVVLGDPLEAPKRRNAAAGTGKVLDEDRIVAVVAVHRDRARQADRRRHPESARSGAQSARACAPPGHRRRPATRGSRSAASTTSWGLTNPGSTRRIATGTSGSSGPTRPAGRPPARSRRRPGCCGRDARSRPALESRPPSFSAPARCGVAKLKTGISPKRTPATSEIASVKSRTGRLDADLLEPRQARGCDRHQHADAAVGQQQPGGAAERAPSGRLSDNSSHAIRRQPAPSAAWIASSC